MRRRAFGQGLACVCFVLAGALSAQSAQPSAPSSAPTQSWAEMTTGSELEQYLRVLQVSGLAPVHQVSLRGWAAVERDSMVARVSRNPWSAVIAKPEKPSGISFALIRPQVQLFGNTGWPYGSNDGAIWQGRGLTSAVSGGFELRAGALTVVVDPVAFRAENAAFTMKPVPSSVSPYSDPVSPGIIDLPQRFGPGAYQRLDPGQSTIRVDKFGLAIGVTTANEIWGPAITSPIVLGDNAAGIPRAFFGTSQPTDIGIGRIHARMFLGSEGQSSWSPNDSAGGRRLAAGVVAVFEPRGLRGFEIGVGRFFHEFWPANGIQLVDLTIPFGAILPWGHGDPSGPNGASNNQVASGYARLVLPRSGVELYGEFGREDHAIDIRDLSGEPDHISAYTLGMMKTWASAAGEGLNALRIEFTNSRVTDLKEGRGEGLFYEHTPITQGHTIYGQLLGSPAVRGGGGGIVAWDRYSHNGRLTFSFTRTDEAGETEGGLGTGATSALTVDAVRFYRGFDLSGQLGVVFDTGVQSSTDRSQLHLALGAKIPIAR